MPSILVKDLSNSLHKKLKQMALSHHRSMNKQVLMILEEKLSETSEPVAASLPKPLKLSFKLTHQWINKAKKTGRL